MGEIYRTKAGDGVVAGRPSGYSPRIHPNLGKWLARDGYTNEQIAVRFGVAASTLQEWIKKYPELSEALKNSKELVRYEVEDSLVKRAKGYEYEKTEVEAQMVGGKEVKKKKVVTMHVPGDVTAQIFYLKTQWKDKYGELILDFEKAKGEINQLFEQMKEEKVAGST